MSSLYRELATVYEAMYHTFIDYKEEFDFYHSILKKHGKNAVVEIGCGTGNLANPFLQAGFEYTGLDLNDEMIDLAKEKAPKAEFMQADMRDFLLEKPAQSIIITARTISYLITNDDVNHTFKSITNNLNRGGILSFDMIDANEFIPMIAKGKEIIHEATSNSINYLRKSIWHPNLKNGMDFKWHSIFYKKMEDALLEIGQDNSIIRAFTLNELEIFLKINGFQINEAIKRPSYAFPTYVIVAEKI
jgi:SAM-dependent methyltransferase